MGGGVEVTGGVQLTRALGEAGGELGHMRDTHAAIGRMIAHRAAAMAPRRSGRLAAAVAAGANDRSSVIGARVAYAGVVHWGWPAHHIRGDPFISRAAQACEAQWADRYREGVQDILDEAAKLT